MKTKETCICDWCGKQKEATETGICNHCGKFGKTQRQLALEWWAFINGSPKQKELEKEFCKTRHFPVSELFLTGREIEEIYIREKNRKILDTIDPSWADDTPKKQFSQFNEPLFSKYFNKFSEEDKLKIHDFVHAWFISDEN